MLQALTAIRHRAVARQSRLVTPAVYSRPILGQPSTWDRRPCSGCRFLSLILLTIISFRSLSAPRVIIREAPLGLLREASTQRSQRPLGIKIMSGPSWVRWIAPARQRTLVKMLGSIPRHLSGQLVPHGQRLKNSE